MLRRRWPEAIAIKIERGRLQIVGVADDAQHRAASARDLAGFDLLAVRLDRLVGPDTKVRSIRLHVD